MDIDELLIVLEKSKGKKIQKINSDFYSKLSLRISELEERRRSVDFQETIRIDDELKTLKRIQRRIFEARTSKIVRAAWAEVCKTETGVEGFENLIDEEKKLFEELIESISRFKEWVYNTQKDEELPVEETIQDYSVVKVNKDIDEFEGVNGKTYKLRKEDVLTLPSLNARILIKAGNVEGINAQRIGL